ncbi:MAG: sulfatase-like hydrolase/transferase [Myxococcota bacterium]|nr:sulfatase-like hydrolase/transferase [Myxococcota bacterium]
MTRLQEGLFVFVALSTFMFTGCSAEKERNPSGSPNVVILVADDLGFADVGYRGSPIQTPGIDRLAEEGLRLERFYAAPICTPTRAALMTGRDPLKLGLAYDQIHPWYNAGLSPDQETLPRAFQAAGYQTALVGKWHLGHTYAHQLPNAQGFDHFSGHLHTNTDYFKHEREKGHDLQENGRPVHKPGTYLTHLQAEEAVRVIRERDAQRPLLLTVAFTAPHSPMQAPPSTVDLYRDFPKAGNRRVYAAMVHEMDLAISEILRTLDEEGIADQTLVFFMSDNGGMRAFGGSNTPLRGEKGQTFEGGIRVPALLRWPSVLPADTESQTLVTVMDVFPTLADAAGVKVPADAPIEGLDMWPTLAEDAPPPEREPFFFASEIPLPGMIFTTVIDDPWKLVQIIREGSTETRTTEMLFRLDQDPLETRDLSKKQPEQVARLHDLIRDWRQQHPMAGTRGTLVPHPGWVAPLDWADHVLPASKLQTRWKNELPFSEALLDATAHRGILVDAATRAELIQQERARNERLNTLDGPGPAPKP